MVLFGKKSIRKNRNTIPPFMDMEGNVLHEGDFVESLRYDLGVCKILKTGEGYVYESVDTGKRVNWSRMIDAHLKNQKVRKLKGAEK